MDLTFMEEQLNIGAIVFPRMDQMDFTGPFEVLSRIPNSKFYVLWKQKIPVPDAHGLILTPDTSFAESPRLHLLVVPGGYGQEALMKDDEVLQFIQEQARGARYVFSVCTGALLCGAAGLLRGVRATTHWSAFHLLGYFGAIPAHRRFVVDGKHVSASGVTAGIDGALHIASLLRGERVAQEIQLSIEYAPEPPFNSGTLATAPPDVVEAARACVRGITSVRHATARRLAPMLGIERRL
jgi:cyclohexyl-isocyanide hydratase